MRDVEEASVFTVHCSRSQLIFVPANSHNRAMTHCCSLTGQWTPMNLSSCSQRISLASSILITVR
jgi:hypothetical protein